MTRTSFQLEIGTITTDAEKAYSLAVNGNAGVGEIITTTSYTYIITGIMGKVNSTRSVEDVSQIFANAILATITLASTIRFDKNLLRGARGNPRGRTAGLQNFGTHFNWEMICTNRCWRC